MKCKTDLRSRPHAQVCSLGSMHAIGYKPNEASKKFVIASPRQGQRGVPGTLNGQIWMGRRRP